MDNTLKTVYKISRIKDKKTGTPGNLKTQRVIMDSLSCFDGKITQETYPITVYSKNEAIISGENVSICGYLHDYTGISSVKEIKGEVVSVGKEIDFSLKNPRGKIIMCQSDLFVHRIIQIQKAIKRGAIALIIVSPFNKEIVYGTGTSYLNKPIDIPAIGITKNQAKNIKNGKVYSIKVHYKKKKTIGKNLIFEFLGTKSPEIVIGAHYDGWSYSAQDNTISLYFMFELIKTLKDNPSRHKYRFVFFDSEELGMVGSYNHLKKNPRNNYKAYINLDSIIPSKGSSFKTILYSKKLKHSIPFIKCLINGYLPISLDFFYGPKKYGFPSDSHHFYLSNIPTITTFSSSKFYHTRKDTFENLDLKKVKYIKDILRQVLINIENDNRKN